MYRHGNNFPLEHDTLHIPLHTPRLLMVSLSSCSEHIQIHAHQRDAHTTIKKKLHESCQSGASVFQQYRLFVS